MKLIGQNSISKYLSHFFFIGFLGFLFYLLYFLFGFFICYLNYKEGFEIFSNTFFVEKKIFTSGIFDFFTISHSSCLQDIVMAWNRGIGKKSICF